MMNPADEKIAETVTHCRICGTPLSLPRRYVFTCGDVCEGILRRRQAEARRRAEQIGRKK